jgi:hypothetical protein
VALVFYKLDARTSFLVKHAEDAMVSLEKRLSFDGARLFTNEVPMTEAARQRGAIAQMWTYGRALRLVFLFAGLIGILGGCLSVCRYYGSLP